jgi:MoxR-like ATPase
MSQSSSPDYRYTGEAKYQPSLDTFDAEGRRYYPYFPGEELGKAVNLAIALELPLLLEGEPGCGKTRLASAIAYELTRRNTAFLKSKKQKWWDYQIWSVKSTSRAQDGLYTYDAVTRLMEAQLAGADQSLNPDEVQNLRDRVQNKSSYIAEGPLGKAFRNEQYRSVVLIDEIDKADTDFPNDLLDELDLEQPQYAIAETGETIEVPHKPIVLITSNKEKPLPDAFLRRCLYYFVNFPTEERLREIVNNRFPKRNKTQEKLIKTAIDRFLNEIRPMFENVPGSRAPGTSEFLAFMGALMQQPVTQAKKELAQLADPSGQALLGTLLKSWRDQEIFRQQSR